MKEKNFEKYKIHLLILVAAVAPPVNRAEHRAEVSGLRKRCYGSLVTDHQATHCEVRGIISSGIEIHPDF